MNKKIAIGVTIVVLAGLGFWLMNSKNSVNITGEVKNDNQQAESQKPEENKKSLRDFLSDGSAQKCEVDFAYEGGNSRGITYIARNQMRGDYTAETSGQKFTTHILVKGNETYTWTDGQKMGFKMTLETQSKAGASKSEASQIDLDQKLNYACDSWKEESSIFALPSGIEFQETNGFLPTQNSNSTSTKTETGANQKAQQCAMCDQVPESSRAECKAALACN